jgi:hypothetical protein
MRKKHTIAFRLSEAELAELSREAAARGTSVDAVARDRLRAWAEVGARLEALEEEVSAARREAGRLRAALAKVCAALLCRAGKETLEYANRWARENILK